MKNTLSSFAHEFMVSSKFLDSIINKLLIRALFFLCDQYNKNKITMNCFLDLPDALNLVMYSG